MSAVMPDIYFARVNLTVPVLRDNVALNFTSNSDH